MNNTTRLNVKFEFVDANYLNPEFVKVKIYIATYGENRNGSSISKEVFDQAIPSLFNVPVIGEWIESIDDFGGHGGKLEKTKQGIKYIQTTKPYGVVNESSDVRWELIDDEEYLCCDAILWIGRYPELEVVLENTNNQSMEIQVLESHKDDNNVLVIDEMLFSALCILGQDTEPCFPLASIVYSLNKDKFKEEFTLMLNEIKSINNNKNTPQENVEIVLEQGGKLMNKEELLTKFSYLKGEKFEEIKSNLDNYEYEDLEKKLFSLSVSQIRRAINEELAEITTIYECWDGCSYEIQKYWLDDILPTESIAIVCDAIEWNNYGIPYTLSGDTAELDLTNIKRYTNADWRPFVEGADPDEENNENSEQEPIEPPVDGEEDDFGCGDKKKMMSKIQEIYSLKHKEAIESVKASFNAKETEEYKSISEEFESLKKEFEAKVKEITEFALKLENLESENNKLVEFKAKKEKEELISNVESIISEFSTITEDEIKDVKEKALNSEITVENFRKELFALEGMKLHKQFSLQTKEKEETASFKFSTKTQESHPYEGLEHLFPTK